MVKDSESNNKIGWTYYRGVAASGRSQMKHVSSGSLLRMQNDHDICIIVICLINDNKRIYIKIVYY